MGQNILKASYLNKQEIFIGNFEVDEFPDTCPICHEGIQPISRVAWYEDYMIAALFQCPKRKCRSLFVSYYSHENDVQNGRIVSLYKYKGSAPQKAIKRKFPDEIITLSEMFCTIFNESAEAEQRDLKNICGTGYRKALEFLIKDYLVKEKGCDQGIIRKIYLGPCIDKYIDEGKIKVCAKRAAWLGNDQTHYDQVWGDKDLEDLKNLIELTVTWIHSEHLTKKMTEEMPEEKKKGGE